MCTMRLKSRDAISSGGACQPSHAYTSKPTSIASCWLPHITMMTYIGIYMMIVIVKV
jgi:hypothetical protein